MKTVESNPARLIEERRLIKTFLSQKPSTDAFFASAITVFLIIVATVFYWKAPEYWSELLPAVQVKFFKDMQLWRAFTAILIHADLEHLLSNLLMLWVFSFFIYGYFGSVLFPLVSFLAASLVNVIVMITYPAESQLLGASGLVYLLGGLWLTLYFLIQRQYSTVNRMIRVVGIAMVLFLPSTFVPSTSYRTHAIGFVAGIVIGLVYFSKRKGKIREKEIFKISYVEDVPQNAN